jgi:pimeloyl-ACP methyl ester carboxylesterase
LVQPERILKWPKPFLGPKAFFHDLIKRAGTWFIQERRDAFYQAAALAVGDVLLYQSRGHEIRHFIGDKILEASPSVTVVAHSLGGIACVDVLAESDRVRVDRLVTLGSQSSFLYEIDILFALKRGAAFPAHFPSWPNVYDRDDFLSFVAGPLFHRAIDKEVRSGKPFPDSHSAYFGSKEVWRAIYQFM